MSTIQNDRLIEEAREIAEIYTSTPLEDAILNNLEKGDLEKVAQLIKETKDYWLAEAASEGLL